MVYDLLIAQSEKPKKKQIFMEVKVGLKGSSQMERKKTQIKLYVFMQIISQIQNKKVTNI